MTNESGRRARVQARGARRSPAASRRQRSAGSLTDCAYAQLEELIVTLAIAPGAEVSEAALSQRLGIGRTPIREALQRLARERLVAILPRKGILVPEIDVPAQLRLLALRREVERLVVQSAAREATPAQRAQFSALADAFERAALTGDETGFMRTDRAFNELCVAASRNEFAAGAMALTHGLSRRFWFMHYRQAADMPLAAQLHAAVARAIAQGRPPAAGKACDALLDYLEAFTRISAHP